MYYLENMKNIVFLGSKPIGYQCLDYLITHKDEIDISILGVLTNDNTKFNPRLSIVELCKKHNIPIISDLNALLQIKEDADLLISVQYHEILKNEHIEKAKFAINLHMAPLPEYRGCNQFSFAIIDNAKEFGTTLHQLEEGIDSGAIIAERRFPIPDNCFVGELYDLTFKESVRLFQKKINDILCGKYTLIPQEELIPKRGTSIHYRKDIDTIKRIDWSWPKEKILRHIRATSMKGFEPPYTTIYGKKIYFPLY